MTKKAAAKKPARKPVKKVPLRKPMKKNGGGGVRKAIRKSRSPRV